MAALAYHAEPDARTGIFPGSVPSADRFRSMGVVQLIGLYESLVTLRGVVDAVSNRPAFEAKNGLYNAAGDYIDELSERLSEELVAVIEALREGKAPDHLVEENRARTLISYAATYAETLPEITAEAAALAVPERH